VHDDLGAGGTLIITSTQAGKPSLILEVTLYQNNVFIALAGGIENTLNHEIQMKEFHPLAGGRIFPGGAMADARTLNGPSGGDETSVAGGAFRSTQNNLLLTYRADGKRRSLVAGGLTYHEFLKWVKTWPATATGGTAAVCLDLKAADPIGKRVDPGTRYVADDRFYVDFTTANPFEALEQYGLKFRAAQKARPNPYDFPTECAWYAGVWKTPGAQNHPDKSKYELATTKGLVGEMDYIKQTGFLKYSRVALRIVPDNYTPDNMNGWWDDDHFQKAGFFVPPYETVEKWGKAIRERGGLPGIYIQPNAISKDFRRTFTNLLLAKSPDRTIDYTNPEARTHMRKVYANLHSGGIATIMFDYCDEMWTNIIPVGGFSDRYATAASFYRTMLGLAKEGLGAESWVHERAINHPGSDIAVGISDSQRTQCDSDKIYPALIARSGLRWYKSRVVMAYDMDARNLLDGWKNKGFTGTDQDGRRMMMTMCYVAASRLLLGNSFRDLPEETVSDLARTLPYPTTLQSARPVDAFVAKGWPSVYDFAVNARWHQLTLLNNTEPTAEKEIVVLLGGNTAEGALGLDPAKEYYLYDFWNDRFVGRLKGGDQLRQTLRAGEARMISIHQVETNPQFISTSRHIMQGYLDMPGRPVWDESKQTLAGTSRVAGGEPMRIVLALNGRKAAAASSDGGKATLEAVPGDANLVRITLDAVLNADVRWSVNFE